jgi:flagellar basal-body rod protein FlgG
MTPAVLQQTGEPLDVGLQGPGFFVVQTPSGNRYTRDGQFEVNAAGQLQTVTGYPVLDTANQPIKVGSGDGVTISQGGAVGRNGKPIATLGLVSLTNPAEQGDTLFSGTPGARPTTTSVEQGYLEGSGVNATTAMVDMLTSLRNYQSDQQAVQTIDQTLGEGIEAGGL